MTNDSLIKKTADFLISRKRTEKNRASNQVDTSSVANVTDRLRAIHGEQALDLQLLYEKWAIKESWSLEYEAIPLLLGTDPEMSDQTVSNKEIENRKKELLNHATECISQNLLQAADTEKEISCWRVSPVEIYRWARVSRIELSSEFINLMDYLSSVVKVNAGQNTVSNADNGENSGDKFLKDREMVLGMALAIVATYPDACRNSRGRINVNQIMNIIEEKKSFWLGDYELQISDQAVRDLIQSWLDTATAHVS